MHRVVFADGPASFAKRASLFDARLGVLRLRLKHLGDLPIQSRAQGGVEFLRCNPLIHITPAIAAAEADQPLAIGRNVQCFFGLIERKAVNSNWITLLSFSGVRAMISLIAAITIQVIGELRTSCMAKYH